MAEATIAGGLVYDADGEYKTMGKMAWRSRCQGVVPDLEMLLLRAAIWCEVRRCEGVLQDVVAGDLHRRGAS